MISMLTQGSRRIFRVSAPRFSTDTHQPTTSVHASFTRRRDQGGTAWQVVRGLGRSGDSMPVFPATVSSRTTTEEIRSNSHALDYDMHLFSQGECELHIDCLPTHPVAPGRGVRLAVSLDNGAPKILEGPPPRYPQDVLTNLRRFTTKLTIKRPGRHSLAVWMVDPGVIVNKIVLHTTRPVDSYLGPPESFRATNSRE